jgi:hypothetical protein
MSDKLPRPRRRPPVTHDFDPCDRCGVRIQEPIATRVVVHTPDRQYRFGEKDLCLACAASLWKWFDAEIHRDDPPDFVAESVAPDIVIHPRTKAAHQWVSDTVGGDSELYLCGGVVVPQGCERLQHLADYVATHIAADGLRIADPDECLGDRIGTP